MFRVRNPVVSQILMNELLGQLDERIISFLEINSTKYHFFLYKNFDTSKCIFQFEINSKFRKRQYLE